MCIVKIAAVCKFVEFCLEGGTRTNSVKIKNNEKNSKIVILTMIVKFSCKQGKHEERRLDQKFIVQPI